MTEQKKPMKIEFAPGCFDNFEGTQEELDALVAEIHRMFESDEVLENSEELTDEAFEELPEDVKKQIVENLNASFGDALRRLN